MGIAIRKSIISLILAGCFIGTAGADTVQLQEQAPDRYVVVKGDTLWDISGRFLKQPWRWPEIWQMNKAEIKDPHWIYPGDTIVLDRSGATPVLKVIRDEKTGEVARVEGGIERVSPKVRFSSLEGGAIASIAPASINAFTKRARVIDPATFNGAARVAASNDAVRTIFAPGDTIYAVNLVAEPGELWQIYRSGQTLLDPDTQQVLGHEIHYVGDASVTTKANVSTLRVIKSKEEISIGDRLLKDPGTDFLNYVPRLPSRPVSGKVVSTYGADAGAGTYATVVLNRGANDGLEIGSILFAYKKGLPIAKTSEEEPSRLTPPAKSGNLFVYRVFPGIAYAMVLDAKLPVVVGDEVRADPAAEEGSR